MQLWHHWPVFARADPAHQSTPFVARQLNWSAGLSAANRGTRLFSDQRVRDRNGTWKAHIAIGPPRGSDSVGCPQRECGGEKQDFIRARLSARNKAKYIKSAAVDCSQLYPISPRVRPKKPSHWRVGGATSHPHGVGVMPALNNDLSAHSPDSILGEKKTGTRI